jgi:hypothetical protein
VAACGGRAFVLFPIVSLCALGDSFCFMILPLVPREGQELRAQVQEALQEQERQRARVRQLEAYVGARAQVGQSWRGASLISFRMSAS